MRSNSLALIPVLILAALLRLLRMHVRWDEITLAYSAYAEPVAQALADGHPTALLGSWIGLHPPLWGVIHALMEILMPVPWVWMGFSSLCSLGAVYLVGRFGGWVPALVLATAPVHLLDAAEVNNYPLASLAVAALVVTARGPWLGLSLAAIFAAWTHLLTGTAAVAVVIWRAWSLRTVDRRALLGTVFLGLLPILGGVLRLMGEGSTWAQPEGALLEWLTMVAETVGYEGLLLAPLVVIGLTGASRIAWLALSIALVVAVGSDAAAAHQRPYLGLLAPAAALAVGVAVQRRRWLVPVVLILCTIRAGRFAAEDIQRFQEVVSDLAVVRGVDLALSGAKPGDTVWLVAPALQTDDDKTASSAVLWRLRPWLQMPMIGQDQFEYKDYRYGQPRLVSGLRVHSSTELYEEPFDHMAGIAHEAGHQVWVVVYDHQPATGLLERIERVVQPYDVTWREVGADTGLGVDLVALVRASQ